MSGGGVDLWKSTRKQTLKAITPNDTIDTQRASKKIREYDVRKRDATREIALLDLTHDSDILNSIGKINQLNV